ncbi:MAG: nicotinate-nucleotide adenylyltransferase [Proteobacteria bacterium]|nr:nicotinate-nucleotide adenylyltransferase [Pseudomonadota bacterium]
MNNTLVFGGTFDPVHRGHLESVGAVARLLGDVDVYLVPCQIPAHRPTPAASPENRLKMLELAVGGQDRFFVDDCELRREGTSYTFDTLLGYREKLGESGSLVFLMGFDSWVTLPDWHRWMELTDLAHLLILERPGAAQDCPDVLRRWSETRQLQDPAEMMSSASGKICFLSLDQIDVSASALRTAIARGDSIGGDVNPLVMTYIKEHNLYTRASSKKRVSGKRMEH